VESFHDSFREIPAFDADAETMSVESAAQRCVAIK
jgi:hypothetical protein